VILIAGIPSEDPLRRVIDACSERGFDYVVLNQRHASDIDILLSIDDKALRGTIWIAGQAYPIDGFTGVYSRTIDSTILPELRASKHTMDSSAFPARVLSLFTLLNDVLDVVPARVVNRPSSMGSNMSKPFQAQHIVATGMRIPETLVTNDPKAVHAFRAQHGHIIYKSISAIRSIVRVWTPTEGPNLADVETLPTQFQAFVPGENIRVHVVDREIFATRIISEAVDYRYATLDGLETTMAPMELPTDVAAACVNLTKSLGLAFSGIDLKRTPAGEWYCFEVNTSPAYSYFEHHGGQPIADTLARFLVGLDNHAHG